MSSLMAPSMPVVTLPYLSTALYPGPAYYQSWFLQSTAYTNRLKVVGADMDCLLSKGSDAVL